MTRAWASDADLRFRAATGGVLSALGIHLLETGQASFILHCKASEVAPLETHWTLSETPQDVRGAAGSRYGPSDTLAGLEVALSRCQPFAIIAKPCDAGAARQRAKSDPRVEKYVVAVLVMVCGGASDLNKSNGVLNEFAVAESELSLIRYRGHGNPGPTLIETHDGRAFEKSYLDMWPDEGAWRIQNRCKVCPDAIGEAADIAAAAIWPGGAPSGEDEGFNGVIIRSARGQKLFSAAFAQNALSQDQTLSPRDFDGFQPHQVRKKRRVAARLRGLARAEHPVFHHTSLRIDELDDRNTDEEQGALDRACAGRFKEQIPEGEK